MTNQPITKGPLPDSCRGWNWGAFLLNWIWGLGNSTYISLLCWIPVVNIVMMFVLGAKGNEWAWRNNDWRDEAHFKKTQRNWMIGGIIAWLVLGYWFFSGSTQTYHTIVKSPVYIDATAIHRQFEQTQAAIANQPTDTNGTQTLNFEGSSISENKDGTGSATFNLNTGGPGQQSHIHSTLTQKDGQWVIQKLTILTSS